MPIEHDLETSAGSISTVHGVTDQNKFNALVTSMKESGWVGRPVLVEEHGDGYQAWTGSHRIAAAKKAGVMVPVVVMDSNAIQQYLADNDAEPGSLFDYGASQAALDDDEKLRLLEEFGDERAIALLREELEKDA